MQINICETVFPSVADVFNYSEVYNLSNMKLEMGIVYWTQLYVP